MKSVSVIGGGLAGCEAAYVIAESGIHVNLFEMKPGKHSPAHKTDDLCELVCSNSLRSDKLDNAVGLLKEELRRMDSLVMRIADETRVPAGGALAVDRTDFSKRITEELKKHPNIELISREITEIPAEPAVIATGPLTDGALMRNIENLLGDSLHFFDAAAPIVTLESLDMNRISRASRYGRGSDYLNCPMTMREYYDFVRALVSAETAPLHEFETVNVFEGCMPVEVMAKRGDLTLAYGPLKPVGLAECTASDGKKPFAVVQLRQDNSEGTLFNIVGFQTNLTYPEQKRVFSMIPGLEHAEFLRYGLMHRNSYIDAPRVLQNDLSLKTHPSVFVAGQLSGVEGYVESAAMGILCAIHASRRLEGKPFVKIPRETIYGGLVSYLLHAEGKYFQPMNANWALIPGARKENRDACIQSSLKAIQSFVEEIEDHGRE